MSSSGGPVASVSKMWFLAALSFLALALVALLLTLVLGGPTWLAVLLFFVAGLFSARVVLRRLRGTD